MIRCCVTLHSIAKAHSHSPFIWCVCPCRALRWFRVIGINWVCGKYEYKSIEQRGDKRWNVTYRFALLTIRSLCHNCDYCGYFLLVALYHRRPTTTTTKSTIRSANIHKAFLQSKQSLLIRLCRHHLVTRISVLGWVFFVLSHLLHSRKGKDRFNFDFYLRAISTGTQQCYRGSFAKCR